MEYTQHLKREVRSFISKIKADKVNDALERIEISIKNFLMPLYSLESFGFTLGVVDGHDIEKLLKILDKAKNMKGPVFLLVKTEKGKGYDFAEKDKEKFHGISPFDVKKQCNTIKSVKNLFRSLLAKKYTRWQKKIMPFLPLSAGMIKGTCLDEFEKEIPERCIDTGIAEGFSYIFSRSCKI